MIDVGEFTQFQQFSVAMTEDTHDQLSRHFDQWNGQLQEDLAFCLWRPSIGRSRYSAVIERVVFPEVGDRNLQGNVAFNTQYIRRVLSLAGDEYGVALVHSHLGPGWQDMSCDDVVAERDRLAPPTAGRTGLPLLGLTWGTDGAWSGRFW